MDAGQPWQAPPVTSTTTTAAPDATRPAIATTRAFGLALFAAVAAFNAVWFSSFSGRTLMGDDLELLIESRSGGYASSLVGSLTQTSVDKFRPVLTAVLSVLTDAFGADFRAYRISNLCLQIVNVGLVGLLAWRLSRRDMLVAASAMILVTISRFNTYFVLQVFGVMEGIALACMLCTLLAVERAWRLAARRPLLVAYASYLLAVFTHERFVVLGPFLALTTLLIDAPFRSRLQRVGWAAIPVAVAISNFVVKALFLDTEYFTGVGGQRVGFTPAETATFILRALLNVVGFNTGPDYLSGRNMHSLGAVGLLLGLFLAGPVLVLALVEVIRDWRARQGRGWVVLRRYALAGALFLPLLLSASITFRQEYRWLYAPYVALVLGVCWVLGRITTRTLRAAAAVLVLLAGVSVDGYYRRHVENTYFFGGLRAVDAVREKILEKHRSELRSTTIFLITRADPVVDTFYLHDGDFFEIYAHGVDTDIRLVASLDDARQAAGVRAKVLVFDFVADDVSDVTSDLMSATP